MVDMNSTVNFYFTKTTSWQKEIKKLRTIVLACGLKEELKWGCPCYTLDGSNIVLIHIFKDYCALLFFKGVLMKDRKDLLIQQTKNVQTARQMRFTGLSEIVALQTAIKTYIKEAIVIEKSGVKVELKKTSEYSMPKEFEQALKMMPQLKKAFFALTPGRQRGYLLYFSSAKQSKTREARIEKYQKHILNGKGLDD